ncbi:uncharacterized protein LOC121867214 isoform X1 [Homarus americanus]|uniref:uncharacterized protein LOC121867214 isoform X1 n=1 Tax=Homarus americanus TaxID=6706 RepID=UPI001C49183A|nr:uncharacterized protein LOC121867214 isoform X1 [Homarus americanus]
MPGLLYLLSWISTLVHICLGTLALAAALYYLAELVEEYTSTAAKVLRYWIWVTIGLYILLFMFESVPTSVILCGFISQLVHLSILRTFPFFFLTSLPFILGFCSLSTTTWHSPSLLHITTQHLRCWHILHYIFGSCHLGSSSPYLQMRMFYQHEQSPDLYYQMMMILSLDTSTKRVRGTGFSHSLIISRKNFFHNVARNHSKGQGNLLKNNYLCIVPIILYM